MQGIGVIQNPTEEEPQTMQVRRGAIWTKEESEVPCHYDERETYFSLEGTLMVSFDNGAPDTIRTCDTEIRNLVLYPPELRGHLGQESLSIA